VMLFLHNYNYCNSGPNFDFVVCNWAV